MNVLYIEWNGYGNESVKREMRRRGWKLSLMYLDDRKYDTRYGEDLAEKCIKSIYDSHCDFVFSLNYFPIVSMAAYACNKKYVSWTYDSPYIQLYSKTIANPNNYAFIFDSAEYINLKNKGVDTVYYLPMAADVAHYDSIALSKADYEKYRADISMVGSLYSEKKHRLYEHFADLDEITKGYLDALISAQEGVYGADLIQNAITADVIEHIRECCPIYEKEDGIEDAAWVIDKYFLCREVTARERRKYLEGLTDVAPVDIYTYEKSKEYKGIRNKGYADYNSEMPRIFKASSINLNITLKSITNGIPLRVFDIMGCGGLLFTNYQSDMEPFFEDGIDYVCYMDKDDLIEKAAFFLKNEEIRLRIAKTGYEKICGSHTFSKRFDEIERISGLDDRN